VWAKPGRLQRRCGRAVHILQVLSISHGSPVSLDIRVLPCQTPEDLPAHASAMAYDLGVAQVRVVTLETPLIQLQLWAKTYPRGQRNFSDANTCTFLLEPKDHDKEALVR
jgi:hypothetical protein